MLFLGYVGQDVRANLPKLRRHLPPTGRDLQILQIQFRGAEPIFSRRACATEKRTEDSPNRAGDSYRRRAARNQYFELLGGLINTLDPHFWN